jgi:hypothetical protein
MIYTFAELKRQVLVKLDEVGARSTTEIVGNELNNVHATICNQRAWSWMTERPRTVTTTVGVREVTLPANTQRLLELRNTTSGVPVTSMTSRQFSAERPALASLTGSATRYVRWGKWPVKRQPSGSMLLRLVSDNVLDTGSTYNIAIKGLDASGEERAIVLTPAGTTPVDAVTALTNIEAVVKTQEWNGNLTLTNVAEDETYLTLFPWEMGRQYPVLYLVQQPTAAETLEHRTIRQPLLLINDYDIPDIPGASALVLVYKTLIQMSTYLRDLNPTDVALWERMATDIMNNLYSQELDDDLLGEPDQTHLPDDGWGDN